MSHPHIGEQKRRTDDMAQTAEQTERIMNVTGTAALTFSAAALIFAACTSATMAQRRGADACTAEVMAQCPGVQPGEGRIRACLREHFKDLSKPCQAILLKAALGMGGRPFPPPAPLGVSSGPFPPPAPQTAPLPAPQTAPPPAPRTATERRSAQPIARAGRARSAGAEGTCANDRHCRPPKKTSADKSGASSGERRVEASTRSIRPHKASAKTSEAASPHRQRLYSDSTPAGYHPPTNVPLEPTERKALFQDFLEWRRQQQFGH